MKARTARLVTTSALVFGLLLAAAPQASADHHFISIREVFPGSTVRGNDAEFIELQMYADGQNVFMNQGQAIRIYDAGGDEEEAFGSFMSNPPNGFSQYTVLFATAAAAASFGVIPDYSVVNAQNGIDPAGGAVCFTSTPFMQIDCVGWGAFNNSNSLPIGTLEPAIPDESSIVRSIAPGCSTLLEPGDDSNNSAADFAPAVPSPRDNGTAPTETACLPPATTPAVPSAGTPGKKKRVRRCKKKPSKNSANAAKKKRCKRRKKK